MGFISGVTHSDGFNEVTWNIVSPGRADYTWATSTSGAHKAPRWYKPLEFDGAQIDCSETVEFMSLLESDLSVNEFDERLVSLVGCFPESLSLRDCDPIGGTFGRIIGGVPTYGALANYSIMASGSASAVRGLSSSMWGGSFSGGTVYNLLSSTNQRLTGSVRSAGETRVPSDLVYLIVGVGTTGYGTVPAGAKQRFKIGMRPLRYSLP